MGLVADEYAAADSYYYFKEPLFYRYPENTDKIFEEYINNPDDFEEFQIPNSYLGQRFHDLSNDLDAIKREGETYANQLKIYYYHGFISKIKELYYLHQDLSQVDIAMEYNHVKRELNKSRIQYPIYTYYFHKGQSDCLRQILLNTPLIKK
jgi:hypothetical protein